MLKSFYRQGILEAGIDEAGRGCLAGPVYAAALIFPEDFYHSEIQDSKMLSASKRKKLRSLIEREALAFSVQSQGAEEIDQINILMASQKAMHQAIENLNRVPELLLVDGNYFVPFPSLAHQCIVKGDSKYLSIAAASILAKTYRDEYMEELDQQFPQYAWKRNKGYPTLEHRKAIQEFGLSPFHRKSFRLKEIDS